MKFASAIVAMFFAAPGIAAAKTPSESTHGAIVAVMQKQMPEQAVLIVGPMAQEGVYIVTRWDTGDANGKGEALAKYDGSKWVVVRSAGSVESQGFLESLGVPAQTAKALRADMKKLTTP
ncbi:MAG: hypothetical protein JO277_10550 [Candidatus Eremiobacteraeota bacterium]|nr:hypothetical protein [Candidatus Eremiobacteraeota bacterium]